MQLTHRKHGNYLLITATGRLDASWSELFTEALLKHVRDGEHQLLVDAAGIDFLSSAGIRSLLRISRELRGVDGTFQLVRCTPFVRDTISSTGFATWLAEDIPLDDALTAPPAQASTASAAAGLEAYVLDPAATLQVSSLTTVFQANSSAAPAATTVGFGPNEFGFGIGEAAQASSSTDPSRAGEFVAAAGHVVMQPPDERGRPDYLIAAQEYIPELRCQQVLSCRGSMAHMFRFPLTDATNINPLSAIIDTAFSLVGSDVIGLVMLGEIEGLVGAALIQPPPPGRQTLAWPAIRDQFSFCGERCYANEQALIVSIAARNLPAGKSTGALLPMPSRPDLYLHSHAAVFPYQPLPNGRLELQSAVARFFGGPPPRAVLHLIADPRPAIGLGESALIRGACWCGPICNPEVLV